MEHVKARRGFAAMSLEKRQALASKGGKSIPKEKRAFSVNHVLATAAGRMGGLASKAKRNG